MRRALFPSLQRPPVTGPDFTRGYLRVPHGVWSALFCEAPLTRRQLQLVAVILRESWGWTDRGGRARVWTPPLRPTDFARRTGLSTDRLAQDLALLVRRGLLHRWPAGDLRNLKNLPAEGRRSAAWHYALEPDPRRWKPQYSEEKPALSVERGHPVAPRAALAATLLELRGQPSLWKTRWITPPAPHTNFLPLLLPPKRRFPPEGPTPPSAKRAASTPGSKKEKREKRKGRCDEPPRQELNGNRRAG